MSTETIKLDAIIGEQLSSVEFVQDYVQFHFGGPHVIAFTWPVVESGGKISRFGETGYRDSLCERITRRVKSAVIYVDEVAVIEFDDGSTFRISLREEDREGPESLLYRAGCESSDPILEY
jgi:hypothetical protein